MTKQLSKLAKNESFDNSRLQHLFFMALSTFHSALGTRHFPRSTRHFPLSPKSTQFKHRKYQEKP